MFSAKLHTKLLKCLLVKASEGPTFWLPEDSDIIYKLIANVYLRFETRQVELPALSLTYWNNQIHLPIVSYLVNKHFFLKFILKCNLCTEKCLYHKWIFSDFFYRINILVQPTNTLWHKILPSCRMPSCCPPQVSNKKSWLTHTCLKIALSSGLLHWNSEEKQIIACQSSNIAGAELPEGNFCVTQIYK